MLEATDFPLYIKESYEFGHGYTLYAQTGKIVCQIANREFKHPKQAYTYLAWLQKVIEHGAKNLQKGITS